MERERFPRGSMPPVAFAATLAKPPPVVAAGGSEPVLDPVKHCDLSTTCPQCDGQMHPEHAHYRCARCGYRDSCCF